MVASHEPAACGPRDVPARHRTGTGRRPHPFLGRERGARAKVTLRGATAAFSLIEVLCAILILGVALAGLTSGLTTALRSARESHLQTAAALFAAGRIETLRAEGYLVDESTDGDCLEAVPNCRWRQSVAATDLDGLHDVTVTIETPAPDSRIVYELRTLLFETPTLASTTGSRDSRSANARSRANGNANTPAP